MYYLLLQPRNTTLKHDRSRAGRWKTPVCRTKEVEPPFLSHKDHARASWLPRIGHLINTVHPITTHKDLFSPSGWIPFQLKSRLSIVSPYLSSLSQLSTTPLSVSLESRHLCLQSSQRTQGLPRSPSIIQTWDK